ncbi:uncharacterized protein N7479_003998 [Penicillium vulpinum]|uniref:Uncharacterized protein n=1 Tax=Penicillium vulpinum TaxID=29845 RepID=A0A1V6SCN5_9EURO|nr:uncharacterized protein N7479_003998 [Penicillium vulpinum]KAJ5964122.1 hypothetical protein N7479_003998 [Penicillium vulpinum]OQE11550.1 hypothetical protein PENVUL_c002G09579 [Penicillium vulpinum]
MSSTNDFLRDNSLPLAEKHGWVREDERGYSILERPHGTLRPFRIIHVGAGASGIIFSKFMENYSKNISLQIYEKNPDIGGTWLENRYPGCACDIPSACYQFSWARTPNWSHYYSSSQEIWSYFNDVVENNGLRKYMKLSHTVVGANWNEEEGLWHVKIRTPEGTEIEDTCNILVNGGGVLNNWKWPDIEGLHSFKGLLQHSAHYDESIDLTGKRVAVIGIGSSGVQLISSIAPTVEKLYTWIRSPTWITAGFAQKFAGPNGGNFEYTEEQKKAFRDDPESYLRYSKMIESELNQRFKFILNGTPEAEGAKEFAINEMKTKLGGDKELCEAMIPKDFGIGCRRPTPGNGFLEALNLDNVHAFTKQLQRITPAGFVDADGVEHEVDAILCATGFDTSWIPRFPIVAGNYNVQDLFAKSTSSWISIGVPHIPNYYMQGGPYGPLGHGSTLAIFEATSRLVLQIAEKMQTENIKSVTPKIEVCEEFAEHAKLFLNRTAWTGPCSSWFKQGKIDGPLAMFPGSRLSFLALLEKPRLEDCDLKYFNRLNRYEFLGNGFHTREFDGRDLSHYLGLLGGKDVQPDLS